MILITPTNIKNYKEILLKSVNRGVSHIYYFENTEPKIKGLYVLEDPSKIYLSICAISNFLGESIYETLPSKYFDIDHETQKQCFLIDKELFSHLSDDLKAIIDIIFLNHKKGTPRKHLTAHGERINIQLQTVTPDVNYFKE